MAISLNFSNSHLKTNPLDQGSPGDAHLRLTFNKDSLFANDTLQVTINLGTASSPVKDIYGLRFSITADPQALMPEKSYLRLNNSFFGNKGTNMLGMENIDPSSGLIRIGLVRTDHQNVSGYGTLATLYIPVQPVLQQKFYPTSLEISDNKQISYNEKPVPLYISSDTVIVKKLGTGINNIATSGLNLSLFPNPASNEITLTYTLPKAGTVNFKIMDMEGKQVAMGNSGNQSVGQHQTIINLAAYGIAPGIYIFEAKTTDSIEIQRLIKR